jgi:hypothetical protein
MHLDDPGHGVRIGEPDVMEEAAAQERIRKLLLVVRRDDHDGALPCPDGLAGLVDEEFHTVELEQQIVRELDVGLVDLVDEQHRPGLQLECLPQLAALDVVADVRHPRVAELAVAQS